MGRLQNRRDREYKFQRISWRVSVILHYFHKLVTHVWPRSLSDLVGYSYLSCDKFGVLTASHEAISPEESFRCIPARDSLGVFSVQTEREKFITIAEDSNQVEVRGDADLISFNTNFRIRMQARFKPKLKAKKETKAQEKVSRKKLESVVGRRLEDDEVKLLKKARVQGDYHEAILHVRVKGKHDKYS